MGEKEVQVKYFDEDNDLISIDSKGEVIHLFLCCCDHNIIM